MVNESRQAGVVGLENFCESGDDSLNCEDSELATSANVVNLDALIGRADLAVPGEAAEDIVSLPITGLEPKGFLYPALRKPDFQRETANWSPEQVADLVRTFAFRDLIPAVILWRAGKDVFVIDGAHRLSALIAWVHDDYGDGEVSRRFFHNFIPEAQIKAAEKARAIVQSEVGSYRDHKVAIEYPDSSRPDIAARAARIGWQDIQSQWIRNADHDKAEKAFFRINQGGTKIDVTEQRILSARQSATALSARAILRAGTGHSYWKKFSEENRTKIEELGREVYDLLFKPSISMPISTLDLPTAGQGYGPHVLPMLFDLVNIVNDVQVADSTRKQKGKDEALKIDPNGDATINYLTMTRDLLRRICSKHAASLGIHPAIYFYSPNGAFQASALLSFVSLIKNWETKDFREFSEVRSSVESFLLENNIIREAIGRLGSGIRSRPRIVSLYKSMIREFMTGNNPKDFYASLRKNEEFSFLLSHPNTTPVYLESAGGEFTRGTKGAAYLRDALPVAPKCPTCGGIMHVNGMQVGHIKPRRQGGTGELVNSQMQHPFCNSTIDN